MRLTLSKLTIVVLASLVPTVASALGSTPEACAQLKMKSVGKLAVMQAKCHSESLGSNTEPSIECLERAAFKLSRRFEKAERNDACHSYEDAPVATKKIETCLEDIVGDLACGNGLLDGDESCDDGNFDSGDGCSPYCEFEENGMVYDVVFRLDSTERLEGLEINVAYNPGTGDFEGQSASTSCLSLLPGGFQAFNDDDSGMLRMGQISLTEFSGPHRLLARCRFTASSTAPLPSDFAVTVVEASGPYLTTPLPEVSVAYVIPAL